MKTDIRIVKTKSAIEDSFIELVQLKGYNEVTLVDIAKKARINRNTIYLHYESKESIIESIIQNKLISQIEDFDLIKYLKSRGNRFKLEEMYKAIFKMVDEHIELYRLLLLEESLVGYFNTELLKMKKFIMHSVKPGAKNENIIDFLIHGAFGVLSNYVVYAKGTEEENSRILADLTMSCMRRVVFSI